MGIFDIFKRKKKSYHHVFDVTDDSFKVQVVQRSYKQPVMVDFWASWCGPCRQFSPVLEKIAIEPDSGFRLAMLNTEGNPRTAARFSIRSIPAVKVFYNGQIVGEFTGGRFEHQVRQFIDEIVDSSPPAPRLKMSDDPKQRLRQAKGLLRRGKGFEAAVFLRDLQDADSAAEAAVLLPLAEFLWDLDDGDGWTDNDKLDTIYADTADALDAKNPGEALTRIQPALELGSDDDRAFAGKLAAAIEAL